MVNPADIRYICGMNEDIRDIARKRVKAKRDFWNLLLIFGVIAVIMNVIWLMSGYRSYYWPTWPMIGFAIALFFTGIGAYGPGNKPISDDAIDREVKKLNGES